MSKQMRGKIISMLLTLVMALTMTPVTAMADSGNPPQPYGYEENILFGGLQINFNYLEEGYLQVVKEVIVDGEKYQLADSYSWSLGDCEYKVAASSYNIQLGIPSLSEKEDHNVVISAEGYKDLNLKLSCDGHSWTGEVMEEITEPEIKRPPVPTEWKPTNNRYDFKYKFEINEDTKTWFNAINDVIVSNKTYSRVDYTNLVFKNNNYCLAEDDDGLYAYIGEGDNTVEYIDGRAECIIKADGYEDLTLELNKTESEPTTDPESPTELKNPPVPSGSTANFGYDFKILFNDSDWLSAITGVTVAGESYTAGTSSFSVWNNTSYYADTENNCIYIGEGGNFVDDKAICVISAEGYNDLMLKLDKSNYSAQAADSSDGNEPDPVEPPAAEKKPAPGASFYTPADSMDNYYIQFEIDDKGYISGVDGVNVNGEGWQEQTIKMGLSGKQYYLDKDSGLIAFNNMPCQLNSGDIITITNPGYEDMMFKISIAGGTVTVAPADENTEQGDEYELHIRLVGSFEAALEGQEGYDSISGASTNININKNSDVTVEAALMKKGEELSESDWKVLDTNSDINVNASKTNINLDKDSGMEGFYSVYDGSLTLSGTPAKAGNYPISVTVTDDHGRTAVSNELIFKVYTGEEYLEDQLILKNCIQTSDGKYMYDMEPWAIRNFDNSDDTVTVPVDVKAWYGSHTSGTYGELGYAIPFGENTVQTLVVPANCDLTMVNMDVLSSVRIVVTNGGKLTLRDSVIQGTVEVENGGTFSMNYDSYSDKFLMGSSINGQLILQDGATVDNAIIYSNTNYIANGDEARRNSDPVVTVNGNVTMKGQVIIRGDEAPTGGDGQSGLTVNNGTVTVPKGSVLAVYGGGYSALTKDGGDAVILNNGAVAGNGKFIAVGGWSADVIGGGSGGNAVSGTGEISIAEAYLQGGSVYKGDAGRTLTDSINISDNTNRNLIDGKVGSIDYDDPTYWHGATLDSIPDLNKDYPVENNAPGNTEPEVPEKPDAPSEPETGKIIIDGKEIENSENILNENGGYDFSNEAFANGAQDAYLVTAGDETQLVGDTSLKHWVGTWQSWEKFIYPDETVSAQYPHLAQAWEQAYTAYIAAFAAAGVDMSASMPNVDALKAYWASIASTKGVDSMTIEAGDDGSYTITWEGADGNILSSDTYTMTGKILKGFEGTPAYVFTADTLDSENPYKYFISMVPGMDGTKETPIAAHFHFQFGNSLDEMLLKGELYNSDDYGTGSNGRPVNSNLKDSRWYATVTDANADPLADYNVILGMHTADKWTELPKDSAGGSIGGNENNSEGSTGDNSGNNSGSGTGESAGSDPNNSFGGSSGGDSGGNSGNSSNSSSGGSAGSSSDSSSAGNTGSGSNSSSGGNGTDIIDNDTPLSYLSDFADVSRNAYYADAVYWAAANNITSGTGDSTFSPDQICTRAQAVTFLYRLMKGSAEAADTFNDVTADKYYAAAVAWAVENGITNGISAAAFGPDLTVTRAQMVSFLYRAAGSPDVSGENPFSDVTEADYYNDAVLWAVQNNITTGTSDEAFSPNDLCTRAQVVTFMYRYTNLS